MARGRYGDGVSWRAVRAERLAAESLLVFQLRAATLRLATARLRSLVAKANFDPNQPRVPRGESGGGRWTDGGMGTGGSTRRPTGEPVRLAQARGGRGGATPMLRIAGNLVELSPAQAIRYEVARTSAAIETARVRAIPGSENWQPPAGLYSTVEGAIRQQEAIGRAAIAYRYGRSALPNPAPSRGGIGHNSGDPRPLPDAPIAPLRSGDTQRFVPGTLRTFAPNGVPLGVNRGSAGPDIFTLDQTAFDQLLANVLRGSARLRTLPASYVDKGYWIELVDRCIVGLRWSKDNGPTMEIVRSPDRNLIPPKTKFHRGPK